MKAWLNRESKRGVADFERKSQGLPYLLVLVGFFFILTTPIHTKNFEKTEGKLQNYRVGGKITLIVGIGRSVYEIETKKNVLGALPYLDKGVSLELYTKKGSTVVKHLVVNDVEVVSYNWFREIRIQAFLIVLGLVIIIFQQKGKCR